MIKNIKFRNIQDISYNINFYERLVFITGEKSNYLIEPFYTLKNLNDITPIIGTATDSLSYIKTEFLDNGYNRDYTIMYNKEGIRYEFFDNRTIGHNNNTYKSSLTAEYKRILFPIIIDFNVESYINSLYSILAKELLNSRDSFQAYLIIYLSRFNIVINSIEVLNNDILFHYNNDRVLSLKEHSKEIQLITLTYSIYLTIFAEQSVLLYINGADKLGKDNLEKLIKFYMNEIPLLQLIINTNNPYFVGSIENNKYIKPKYNINNNQIIRSKMNNQQLLIQWK